MPPKKRTVKNKPSTLKRKRPEKLGTPNAPASGVHVFKPPLDLPLTPKRGDGHRQAQRRDQGRAAEFDRRFRMPRYSNALRKILVKLAHLTFRGRSWRLPLNESNDVFDNSIRHTMQFKGEGHSGRIITKNLSTTVRLLSTELETIVSDNEALQRILWRAYRHLYFGDAFAFFKSGGIKRVTLTRLHVTRISLSLMRKRESRNRSEHSRKYRRTLARDPRQIFGSLRTGKRFHPNGRRKTASLAGTVWILESRSVNKKKRLVVVERRYDKKGKSIGRGTVLWRPKSAKGK